MTWTVSVSQLFPAIATEYCFWGSDFLSEQILQSLDKDAHGCGTGGGRNNAEVFHLAGLTVLTSEMQMAPNKMVSNCFQPIHRNMLFIKIHYLFWTHIDSPSKSSLLPQHDFLN